MTPCPLTIMVLVRNIGLDLQRDIVRNTRMSHHSDLEL